MKTDFTIADKESPIAEAIEDKKNRQKKIQKIKQMLSAPAFYFAINISLPKLGVFRVFSKVSGAVCLPQDFCSRQIKRD